MFLFYNSIALLKKYMLRAFLIGLPPGRQTISCGFMLVVILVIIVILQYRIESMSITLYDDMQSGGTDNNQKKALKSRMFLANWRCSLKI